MEIVKVVDFQNKSVSYVLQISEPLLNLDKYLHWNFYHVFYDSVVFRMHVS